MVLNFMYSREVEICSRRRGLEVKIKIRLGYGHDVVEFHMGLGLISNPNQPILLV